MEKRTRGKEVKGKGKGVEKEQPKSVIYVLTEGDTEEIYLKHFSNRKYNVYVEPVDPEHTDAVGIVRYAKKNFIDKRNRIELEKGDRVYCVFDSDPISNPNIDEAFDLVRGNRDKGLRCIFSNPCFEVWFIMHYESPPYGKNAEQMKKKIRMIMKQKEQLSDYKETTDIFEYLKPHQEKALEQAIRTHKSQKQVHERVHCHACNPYTDIFEFIQYIEECRNRNKCV